MAVSLLLFLSSTQPMREEKGGESAGACEWVAVFDKLKRGLIHLLPLTFGLLGNSRYDMPGT